MLRNFTFIGAKILSWNFEYSLTHPLQLYTYANTKFLRLIPRQHIQFFKYDVLKSYIEFRISTNFRTLRETSFHLKRLSVPVWVKSMNNSHGACWYGAKVCMTNIMNFSLLISSCLQSNLLLVYFLSSLNLSRKLYQLKSSSDIIKHRVVIFRIPILIENIQILNAFVLFGAQPRLTDRPFETRQI